MRCRSPSAPPGLWRAPARRAAGHLTVAVADVTATKDARSIPRGDPSPTGRPQSHLSPRPFQDPIVTFGSIPSPKNAWLMAPKIQMEVGTVTRARANPSIEGMWRVATGRPTCRAGRWVLSFAMPRRPLLVPWLYSYAAEIRMDMVVVREERR